MKKAYIIVIIALIGLALIWALRGQEEKNEFLAEYPDKIVYTTDMSLPIEEFENDCQARNGEFNDCGSPCSSDEELCAAVCAYTCAF